MSENTQASSSPPSYTMTDVQGKWDSILKNSQYSNCNYLLAMQNAWNSNPYVRNDRLKRITSYPVSYDRDKLEAALKDPRANEQVLREASWMFNYTIAPIMKMNNMYPDILLYANYIIPKNADKSDYKKPSWKKEWKFVHDYIDKLNPKRKFRNMVMQTLREGKVFVYKREQIQGTKIDFVDLQHMPSDWCKITYRTPQNGYGYSFNLFFFNTAGNSVSQYAPEFTEYIEEMWGCVDKENPSKIDWMKVPPDVLIEKTRHQFGDSQYLYWKELDPRKAFVLSFDDTDAATVPVFSSSFLSAQDLSAYRALQQELLSLPLSQIMTASVPLNDNNKSGSYGNDTKISPELILLFQGIFDSMANGIPVRSFFAPFEDYELHKLDAPNRGDIVGEATQNFFGESGLTGLMTTSNKPSIAQIRVAQKTETAFVKKLYDQIEDIINTCFKNLDLKFEFEFKLFGDEFSKDDEYKNLKDSLMAGHKYLLPKFAALNDVSILDVEALCNVVDEFKIFDLLEPMQSGWNAKAKEEKKNGRPSANLDKLESDGSANSIEAGTNTDRETGGE